MPNKTFSDIHIYISVLAPYIHNIHDLLLSFLQAISDRGFTFSQGTRKCILCILNCHRNDNSFTVNSLFTKLMVGR